MTINRIVSASAALAVLLSCAAVPAWADREYRGDNRRDNSRYKERGYVLDNRYQHNHYYPPRGHVVEVLPDRHYAVPHHGVNYHYHAGVWYRPSGVRFVVALPPVGVVVPLLPPFYTTIWVSGAPYYYAGGVYYTWRPEERVYVVTQPPPESEVRVQPAKADPLFVYPKKAQGEQQQATDRYQCHRWSADQSGFDPTQPGGNVPESQHPAKRADYQRAMKACLEARGYSVQ